MLDLTVISPDYAMSLTAGHLLCRMSLQPYLAFELASRDLTHRVHSDRQNA